MQVQRGIVYCTCAKVGVDDEGADHEAHDRAVNAGQPCPNGGISIAAVHSFSKLFIIEDFQGVGLSDAEDQGARADQNFAIMRASERCGQSELIPHPDPKCQTVVSSGDEESAIIEEPTSPKKDMQEVLGILNHASNDVKYKVRFTSPLIGPAAEAWVGKDDLTPNQIAKYESKRLELGNCDCAIEGDECEDQTDDESDGADIIGAEDNLSETEMWSKDHAGGRKGRRNNHTGYDTTDGFVELAADDELTMYEGVPPGVDPQEHAHRAANMHKLKAAVFETAKDRLRPARADGLSSQSYVHATTPAAQTRRRKRWERSLLEEDSDDDNPGWLIGGLARWLAGYHGGGHRNMPRDKDRHAGTQARKPAGPQARRPAGARRVRVPSATAFRFHVNNR